MSTCFEKSAQEVIAGLQKHVLVDGFRIVIDLHRSQGPWLVDAAAKRTLLDLYGFYGSMPVGFNHPYLQRAEVRHALLEAATAKVANSDVYTTHYLKFVQTLNRVAGLAPLERYFFIDGGALAVENALKAAMDWKVRKNLAAGRGERGTEILHFEHAFHGRSGYTLSLTNTDPRKTDYFAKFPWPRVSTPSLNFGLREAARLLDVQEREDRAEREIREVLNHRAHEVAAIIAEPIQGEGGDNHFRGEWLRTLRGLCDEFDVLLIFDEVQTGLGVTGKAWCCEHFDVKPDLLAFGKKVQVCGVMAGPRLDEVADNCFRLPSRINSTWGGNLVDMVRSTCFLEIMEREQLIEHARKMGKHFLEQLQALAAEEPLMTAVRGRGFLMAFDLPDTDSRDRFHQQLFETGLLAIRCGSRSIRFRPALDLRQEEVHIAMELLRETFHRFRGKPASVVKFPEATSGNIVPLREDSESKSA
ncbi:MAG TPA: L-lysine 6-transaminase [Candidatus Saccharimonadales bacterium]|nr:L-lysine 6-transaminase [Candidatus Saccharimonadales bacterium]